MKKHALLWVMMGMLLLSARAQAAERVELLRYVPSTAVAALVAEDSSFDQLQEFLNATPEMRKDLATFLSQRLGADLTQIDGFVVWASQLDKNPTAGAFLRIPSKTGAVSGKAAGVVNGIKLYETDSIFAATVPGGVLLGNKAGVRLSASLSGKKVSKLSLASKGALKDMLKIRDQGDVVAAFAPRMLQDRDFKKTMDDLGIHHVVMTVNHKLLRLEAIGDAQRLEQARGMLEGIVAMGLQKLWDERNRVISKKSTADLSEGVGVIVAYHQARKIWEEIKPQLRGDRLVSEYRVPDFSKYSRGWMTWAGIMSAVTIPRILKGTPPLMPVP